MFSKQLQEILTNSPNSWCLCFEIESKNGKILRLTDASRSVKYLSNEYVSRSGIEFFGAKFEDSGYSKVILKGFFEDGGICKNLDLSGSIVKVFICVRENNLFEKWLEYECNDITIDINSFQLILVPFFKKCESSVVEFYSATCRANFGDKRCGLGLELTQDKSCDKSFRMCCNKYNNAVNFRGEPFIPTLGYFNSNEK